MNLSSIVLVLNTILPLSWTWISSTRRRVKADVGLEIPPKKEVLVYCPLTPRQREMYQACVEKTIADLLMVKKEETPDPEGQGLFPIKQRKQELKSSEEEYLRIP